ncbi:MAG: hypothetical protein LBI87_07555 [Candidatus Accumulibacter sp.]|jgi:hypothetical protein|nr:hypothetical protein [Accumulibacter sp.]
MDDLSRRHRAGMEEDTKEKSGGPDSGCSRRCILAHDWHSPRTRSLLPSPSVSRFGPLSFSFSCF